MSNKSRDLRRRKIPKLLDECQALPVGNPRNGKFSGELLGSHLALRQRVIPRPGLTPTHAEPATPAVYFFSLARSSAIADTSNSPSWNVAVLNSGCGSRGIGGAFVEIQRVV